MNYPEDFKARCKEVFPEWEKLHEFLDKGTRLAGRYLCDAAPHPDAEELSRIIISDPEKALHLARRNIMAADLYEEWGKIDDAQGHRE